MLLGLLCVAPMLGLCLGSSDEARAEAGDGDRPPQRRFLIFGGNGFLGTSTVVKFIRDADNVTIVNRGNWYWDSSARVRPFVKHIVCDRNSFDQCEGLKEYVSSMEKVDAVIDFSAYSGQNAKHVTDLLQGKVGVYIMISTDSVYDVSDKEHNDPSEEKDARRPEDEEQRKLLTSHHEYGHRKFQAEEEILAQRVDGGFPYVILRLPDVIGPRDTTFRFWIYQLWLKLSRELTKHPVEIPEFLVDYPMSLVYVEDVADVIYKLTKPAPEALDQVFNLAWPQTFTLAEFLKSVHSELGLEGFEYHVTPRESNPTFFYPSVRRGPISVSKAESILSWQPTPWEDAIRISVQFYEKAMKDETYLNQMNEVIQIVGHHLYSSDLTAFYTTLEKTYDINLSHFRPKEEL